MSKISQMAQRLQKQSQELQTNTEAELASEFKKHKDFIKSNLSEQQNVINSYTEELTEQMKQHTAKTSEQAKRQIAEALEQTKEAQKKLIEGLDQNTTKLIEQIERTQKLQAEQTQRVWTVTTIVMMMLTGIALIALLILIYLASEEASKLQRWAKSADYWKDQSENIMIAKCNMGDQTSKYCVQIDPRYKGKYWGENGDLMILAPTNK